MNWADEFFVKDYTRDTTEWLGLSWKAQGLFCLLQRKVDRSGTLELGRRGKVGITSHIGGRAAWPELEPALNELLEDGWVEMVGTDLFLPEFIESQRARQSDRVRQAESRARLRDRARHEPAENVTERHAAPAPVTSDQAPPPNVTEGNGSEEGRDGASQIVTGGHMGAEGCDAESQIVTESHGPSHAVTSGHTASHDVTSRLDQSRSDQITTPLPPAADAAAGSPHPQAVLPLQLTAPPRARRDFDYEVFLHWRDLFAPRAIDVLDLTRRKIIAKRRAERSKDAAGNPRDPDLVQRELLGSLDGWKNDPWAERHLHCRLEQLLGNAGDVDQGLRFLAAGPPKPGAQARGDRQAGGYASEAEILAQDFTLRPGDVPELEEAQ